MHAAPVIVTTPSDREVRVVREFRAPRDLLWRCHTEPALVQRWMLGPPGWTMPVCKMDVRPGGAYKWRWRSDADGKEFGFFGTFEQIDAPALLSHLENYDPGDIGGAMPTGEPALVTTRFEQAGAVTTLATTMRFASKEARDGAVSTGMTDGMAMSYALLEEMINTKSVV